MQQMLVLLDEIGVSQAGARVLRRTLKAAGCDTWSENALSTERLKLDSYARDVFGDIEKIEAGGGEHEEGVGHRLPLNRVPHNLTLNLTHLHVLTHVCLSGGRPSEALIVRGCSTKRCGRCRRASREVRP